MKFWKKSESEDDRRAIKRPYVLWFLAVLLLLTTVKLDDPNAYDRNNLYGKKPVIDVITTATMDGYKVNIVKE